MKVVSEIEISAGKVVVNGAEVFRSGEESGPAFFKEAYLSMNDSYPKFYKMDEVSKLYFLGVEFLLKNSSWTRDNGAHTTLVAGTTTGCLTTDNAHIASIYGNGDAKPSPALFVYTLPNIMLGEVCIRHGITGENTCFIIPTNDTSLLDDYARILLSENNNDFCIKGYVNFHPEKYECRLSLLIKA